MKQCVTITLLLLTACGGDVVLQDRPPSTSSPTSTPANGACAALTTPADACSAYAEDAKSAAGLRSMLRAREVLLAARQRLREHCDRITDALGMSGAVATDDKIATAACTRARDALDAKTSRRISQVLTASTVECTLEPPLGCAGVVPTRSEPLYVGCPDAPVTLNVPSDLAEVGTMLHAELPPLYTASAEAISAGKLYDDAAGDLAQVGAVGTLPDVKLGCVVTEVTRLNDEVIGAHLDAVQAQNAIREALGQ